MNCREVREKITESLAAGGASLLSGETTHVNSCSVCREFYEKERALFASMDAGLQIAANSQVPPSLLPGLRARLERGPGPRTSLNPGWRFALLAAASVLVLSFLVVRHLPDSRGPTPDRASVTPPEITRPASVVPPTGSGETAHSRRSPRQEPKRLPRYEVSEPLAEVIVLAEEREAFVRFVAKLPDERAVALALANPAPPRKDIPVEVALLQIDELHVRPLEPTEEE